MSAAFMRDWAKEMVLGAIDKLIEDAAKSPDATMEEELVLKLQRNRVAKFLGLKEI